MRKILVICLFFVSLNAALIGGKFPCENCENLASPKRVYASNPTLLYALYAFDRDLPVGLNFEFWDIEKKYLEPKFYNLPVVGGFFGQGKTPNMEILLQLEPDLILTSKWTKDDPRYGGIFQKLKIPTLYIDDNSTFGEEIFSAFGEVFANQKRADELNNYAKENELIAQKIAAKIAHRPSVYYAFGSDGLQSECGSSGFVKLIDLAGGDTTKFRCKGKAARRVKADFEQVLAANPEVIFVYHKEFFDKIYADKKWALIDAVKQKRVYLIPRSPFSWVGKPASFMKNLGFRWAANLLQPEIFKTDIRGEARRFYLLFLGVDLSQDDLDYILNEKN